MRIATCRCSPSVLAFHPDQWRLKLQMLTRHGIEDEDAFKPKPFSLIMTIADPEKKVQVDDEMAQIVRNRFQSQNLTVRATARVRTKP